MYPYELIWIETALKVGNGVIDSIGLPIRYGVGEFIFGLKDSVRLFWCINDICLTSNWSYSIILL
jgi:hypothetical protein